MEFDTASVPPAEPIFAAPRRRVWPLMLAGALVAFVLGVLAMAAIARYLPRAWQGEQATVATATAPPATRIVVAPVQPIAPADLPALQRQADDLANRLNGIDQRSHEIDEEAGLASLYATRAEGLMVAFAARRAINRGVGLGYLESSLQERFGPSQPTAVAAVIQAAREPVTLEDLRAGLDGVAPDLVTGTSAQGWWRSFTREIGNLVILRRAGTPSPLPADRLARARRLIDAGQIEAALAEVAHMPGADSAQNWLDAARRYIRAREALDLLEAEALRTPLPMARPAALPAALPATVPVAAPTPMPTPAD